MAAIRKRRDKFQVQVRRKGFPPVTKSFHRLSDAREWARQAETQADRHELSPDRRSLAVTTLSDLVIRYRDTVLTNKKGGQIEKIILTAFLRHPICTRSLANLSRSDFAAWRDERLKGTGQAKAITPKSVKRLLSPIQHMFGLAMEEWGIPLRENPLAKFRIRVTDNKRQRRLREGELDKLFEAIRATTNPYLKPITLFALETAMRRGEILSILWDHIDLERRSLVIPEAKNGHSRRIPLSIAAVGVIQDLGAGEEGKSVFPITPMALRLAWTRLTKRACIVDLHFHDLRHEAISRFFELGLTVPEVASISGHRDIRMLMRYAHADATAVRRKLDAEDVR